VTRKDNYPEPEALVLSMRKLITDAPALEHCSNVAAPLVLQAHQRVGPPSLGPIVLTREDQAGVEHSYPEVPKPAPAMPVSHDPEYLEVIGNLRRALAGPMRDELSDAVRTMIDDRDP
jgi:hypothetical protein